MEATRHARIREVFLAVHALPAPERGAALERACAGDAALRREVESLLAHDRDGSILAAPLQRKVERRVTHVTFGEGAGAEWEDEQRQLLHQRLRLWSLILHVLTLLLMFRAFGPLAGWSKVAAGPRAGILAGYLGLCCLSARVIFLRAPSVRWLRRLDLALTTAAGTVIFSWGYCWLTRGVTLAAPASPQIQELLRDVYWVIGPADTTHLHVGPTLISAQVFNYFSALAALHGIIVPSTWRRSCAMALAVVLAAGGAVLAAAVANPALRPHLVANLLTSLSIVGLFAAIGLHTGLRFQALRRAVFTARQLGQYRLERLLGRGAMGEVYLARHRLLHRPCAVKLIRPEQAGSEEWLLRFEREVQAMAQLTHPNTVEVYDFGRTADGSFFCAMEYLPGMTLDALVRAHGPLPPGRAVYLLRQVCGALAEAHEKGLVHRDVKPGNIVVCERGGAQDFIKLLDFGLVHVQAEDPRGGSPAGAAAELPAGGAAYLTHAGQLLGTPAYMAPEQIRTEQPDARSDIYSLGGVAWFLVTGRPVFERETLEELWAAHLSAPVPRLRDQRPEIPADLESVVLRCLAKEPAARFQRVTEVEAALAATAAAVEWDGGQAASWWQEQAMDTAEARSASYALAQTLPSR